MRIHFMRHADAMGGFDDEKRPLSNMGRHQAACIGKFLKTNGMEIRVAFCSPLARAVQTSEIVLAQGGAHGCKAQPAEELRNECGQRSFQAWLRQIPPAEDVLLVGHAPSMGDRAGVLLGVKNHEAIQLTKGGIICIETADFAHGYLVFSIFPELLS